MGIATAARQRSPDREGAHDLGKARVGERGGGQRGESHRGRVELLLEADPRQQLACSLGAGRLRRELERGARLPDPVDVEVARGGGVAAHEPPVDQPVAGDGDRDGLLPVLRRGHVASPFVVGGRFDSSGGRPGSQAIAVRAGDSQNGLRFRVSE